MKKYNIALLPRTKTDEFLELSAIFSILPTNYKLGTESAPHVTICQFYANESDIDHIWDSICSILDVHNLHLKFEKFSYITFDGVNFWVSLLPDNVLTLERMNSELAGLVKPSSEKKYDPHLTLISTTDKDYESKMKPLLRGYMPLSDEFTLAIGECDELGQLTKIIHQDEERATLTC